MNYSPVVLSYFSQSGDSDQPYLQFLEDEYRSIGKAWEQFQIQPGSSRYFEVEFPPRGRADGKEVEQDILDYKQRILIFHFSGHADSGRLIFKDGASNAKGLAGLLGEAQNLKLVFLNGCATHDQVKLLFDNNVKIVIATRGKVNDGIAHEFAETFYKALSDTDYTIKRAFIFALNVLIKKYPDFNSVPTEPIVWRGGLVTEKEEDRDRWELYVKDKYQPELDKREWWKIRLARPTIKDMLAGGSFIEQVRNIILLLLGLLGIGIMVFSVFFIQNILMAVVGLMSASFFGFGLKDKQSSITLEKNLPLADGEVIRSMKLLP